MSARHHYLITYDISDDKRRDRVFKTMISFGDHAQYSVFFCEMDDRELAEIRARLRQVIHAREDQILILDLGHATRPLVAGLEVLGRGYEPPVRTLVV